MIPPSGARIRGLDDPTAKMSKSITDAEYHAVYLLDPPDRARKKIMRAVTDTDEKREICFSNDPVKAGVSNLLEIYEALTGQPRDAIEAHFATARGYGDLKKEVAEVVVESLEPIQKKYRELTDDAGYIDNLLARGAERAASVANVTLETVRERMGFLKARS
jgi:tryptophanyl-tRNA synthetase